VEKYMQYFVQAGSMVGKARRESTETEFKVWQERKERALRHYHCDGIYTGLGERAST